MLHSLSTTSDTHSEQFYYPYLLILLAVSIKLVCVSACVCACVNACVGMCACMPAYVRACVGVCVHPQITSGVI